MAQMNSSEERARDTIMNCLRRSLPQMVIGCIIKEHPGMDVATGAMVMKNFMRFQFAFRGQTFEIETAFPTELFRVPEGVAEDMEMVAAKWSRSLGDVLPKGTPVVIPDAPVCPFCTETMTRTATGWDCACPPTAVLPPVQEPVPSADDPFIFVDAKKE